MSAKVATQPAQASITGRNKSLSDLPDGVLLHLATFLSGKDVIHLSHVNQHLFYTLSGSHHLWQRAWIQDKLYPDHVVETLAKKYAHQFGNDVHFDIVSYMLHMHVKSNWQNGVVNMVPPVQVKNIFGWGYDSHSLVALDNISCCYKPDWVILVFDMVAKCLTKHPWFEELPQPTLVKKVLVHEEVVVFQYDDMNGEDILVAINIEIKDAIKLIWSDREGATCKWMVPDVGDFVCKYDKVAKTLSFINLLEGSDNPKLVLEFDHIPFTFACEYPWLAVAHHFDKSIDKEEIFLINQMTKKHIYLVCPPSHHNLPGPNGGVRHTNMLGKILLHAGKVYGLFAHAATLVWDATTGQLVQQVKHNGGLRFKIALSVDFVGLSLEGRDKVTIYTPTSQSPKFLLQEFVKIDISKLVAGCDIILDAQLVHQCLVLYISPRQTHNLQLVIVPLVSKDVEELGKRVKIIDVSSILDLWNSFDAIVDSKLYVTPTLAMIFGDKQFQIIDFVSDVISE